MYFLCAPFATQELPVWFIDSHFRLQLSCQIWKKTMKKDLKLEDSTKGFWQCRMALEVRDTKLGLGS